MLVSCCKFVTSQALTMGNIFMGVYEQLEKFEILTKMHFSKFCGIFKEGWYKNEEKTWR